MALLELLFGVLSFNIFICLFVCFAYAGDNFFFSVPSTQLGVRLFSNLQDFLLIWNR